MWVARNVGVSVSRILRLKEISGYCTRGENRKKK